MNKNIRQGIKRLYRCVASVALLALAAGCALPGGDSFLSGSDSSNAMCGEDHIYAHYAELVKNIIEDNFYVNDTYTCRYAYMSPLPSHGPRLLGGYTHFNYLCAPDNPPATDLPDAYGPVYFKASLSTAALAKPVMKIKIEAYQVIKTYIKTLVGDNIPQPGTTGLAKMDASIAPPT